MAKYEIEDDQGRKLQIELDGEVTPEIASQAFASYDAIGITQSGPRGSEGRRRAQANVSARNSQQTYADASGGSEAGPILSGLSSLGQNLVEFGTKAIAGTARADQILTDAVGNAIRDPIGDILGKSRTEAVDASALQRSDQNPLVQFGTGLTDIAKTQLPVNPKETWANLAGGAIGSVGGTILSGPLAVPAYAASSFESGIKNARDAGATPTQAINQGVVEGLAGGLTERAAGLVPGLYAAKAGAMRGFVRPVAKVIAGETLQEPLEGVAGRASAKYLTGSDPSANPMDVEAALMEAVGGAIGGGFGGSVAAGINARNRGQRLAAIQEYRSPEATILRQVENAPLNLPQNALVMELPNRPAPIPPPGMQQFDGMSSEAILGQVQQRLDQKRMALESAYQARQLQESAAQAIQQSQDTTGTFSPVDRLVRDQRRANVEAGLTMPQVQPVEPVQEPVIGQYPPEGFRTGVIPSAAEEARRAQVRQQAAQRGQQKAQEATAEWQAPGQPSQQAAQPARMDMRVPAILATLNQRQQEEATWRQLHQELAANPVSTPLIEAHASENAQAAQPEVQVGASPQSVSPVVTALESAPAAEPAKPTGARLRKSPLRSEPAAAQSIATSGAGVVASPSTSPAIEESVFGVRSYRGAPTITKATYNRINEAVDAGIAKEDPVAQQIRDLDADAEKGVAKSAGYDQLSSGGQFDAVQLYRNKLYQAALKWADTGKFTFNQSTIAKSVAMDVGKSFREKTAKKTYNEETIGESGNETNLTRATANVLPKEKIQPDTTRLKQEAISVIQEIRSRLKLSTMETVNVLAAYQNGTTADLNDKELSAYDAAKPTLDRVGAINFSVSSLVAEPIGQARAQEAVDNWLRSVGNPGILIRAEANPDLKTPDGRHVAAQVEFSPGGPPIITINGSHIGSEAEVHEKIWHEVLHTVWGDPGVQKAWGEIVGQLSDADVQAQLARGYSPMDATMEAAINAASIRAANTNIRPTWQRFLDSIWQALKAKFGFESKPANFEDLMVSALRSAAGPWNGQQQSRYNQDVAALDKPYMEAVSRGDMAAARQMVDSAAKAAGYNIGPVFKAMPTNDVDGNPIHTIQRPSEFPAFNRDEPGVRIAGFFAADKAVANKFKAMTRPAAPLFNIFLRMERPFIMDANGKFAGEMQFEETGKEFRDAIRSGEYDGVVLKNTKDEGTIYVALDPFKIKSADPVTYDNSGNVVLLSQRFNPESKDIRYSVANNLYVTQPERFKRIAEEGQTEAVVAQGQTASAIIPESTLKEISDLEAKPNRTPVENAALSNLKGVRNIVGTAVVADQIRQANEGEGWGNYRTLDDLPEQYKSVAAQSVMATHIYLNQKYKSLQNRQARVAAKIADLAAKLDGLTEPRLLAQVSNQEADQLLKDLQSMIDLEIGKVGTSAASRTLDELHKASAAVVGLRQKQDAISTALRAIAKEAPTADFASPEAMKSWIGSRQADKSLPQLMTDEVATAIRASLKPGSGLPDRLSLIRALMADTAAAKGQIKDLKAKVGNPKTALKTIIALKMDANSVLNQVAMLDKSMSNQLVQLDGLESALGTMGRMQESKQYQARVESAFRYGGFKYSGMIRYTDRPNGEQTLVGPSGKEYVVNFTPDFLVEKKNLDTIGDWVDETISATSNPSDPDYITDPAKRTSYSNQLDYVGRWMTDRRWLHESAWDNSRPAQVLSGISVLEKAGTLKAVMGDHLETRFNAYRAMAGRAGGELVKRSRAIDRFGAKAKNLTDSMKEPLAVARRKAIQSHGFDPDDAGDLAIWNRKVNSWVLSQNQNPGSTQVKVGDSLGEGIVATREDMAFADLQHRFSRAVGDLYSGADVAGENKNPESPGLSPEEQLFGLDFSRKAMQYGYSIGRQFSEAGQEHTREWMTARAKDLAEYKRKVAAAPEGAEVPMVWTEREKVANMDIEGHVYSHIRESSTDYTSTAGKQLRDAYRELAKTIRRGSHFSTVADVAEALAPHLSTESEDGPVEVGASEAKEALMKALDKDVVNYNRVAELVTQPSNDPTVSDLPKALAAVRSAKGALVKARGKMSAPSYFYDYSLDTDAKRAGMVQMGKQALQIAEINAARNMLSAMRARLAEYDTKIEHASQQVGRNGKKVGTWAATRALEKEQRAKFKAGELQITYTLLKRMADKLETLTKDREDALSRQKVMEEEAFKVSILNFTKGFIASTFLAAPAAIINNLTAVVLDPLRVGLMHGDIGFALASYMKQGGRFLKYAFQRITHKAFQKIGLVMPKKAQDFIADMSSRLFHDMLTQRRKLEDAGVIDSAEPFSSVLSRYKSNPLSFGDTTRAKETATSRLISGLLTNPVLGGGLVPASAAYVRERFPGSGDRGVNHLMATYEKDLSDRIKSDLWLWAHGLEGKTATEKVASAASSSIKAEDLGMTQEQLSNHRTTYDPTGSLERLAADYYLRNPDSAKGDLLTPAQQEAVVFELVSLTNKEVDSTRPEITKGGSGMAGALRSTLYFFQRYALQLLGTQKRAFGVKAGAGWGREFGKAMAYLFMIAMTLFTGALVKPVKDAFKQYVQREPLTSPTITQVAENPELVGKYLTAAAGGVMAQGATLVGAALSGQPLMGPVSANILDNNPIVGSAGNIIAAMKSAYESGDLAYPAMDFARKQLWFTQPLINTLMPGDTAAREAKRAVRTGAVGMEVRESGGAPATVKSTPMTPIARDAIAALYEGDDAKYAAAKQRAIAYGVGSGLSEKEATKRFEASVQGRDPFQSVLGHKPTDEQVDTIIGRASPGQRSTLQRAREGFGGLRKRKGKGLRLRGLGRSRKASGLRRARKPARLRKSSLG